MSGNHVTCEEVIEQLFAFLDQELEGDYSAEIARHLERCRDCFTRADFEKRLRAKVRAAGTARAPDRLQQRVREMFSRFG